MARSRSSTAAGRCHTIGIDRAAVYFLLLPPLTNLPNVAALYLPGYRVLLLPSPGFHSVISYYLC